MIHFLFVPMCMQSVGVMRLEAHAFRLMAIKLKLSRMSHLVPEYAERATSSAADRLGERLGSTRL